jgi:signal peptidase I
MATTVTTKPVKVTKKPKPVPERNSLAEWIVTFLLLIYGTSLIAQPFVIPTSSMENTLMTGDHLIVDKLAYAPAGAISKYILPYQRQVKRGDIAVFRHPINLQEDYVKRLVGIPGDHLKLVHAKLWLNGHPVDEPYVIHSKGDYEPFRDDFPTGGFPPSSPVDGRMMPADRMNDMLHTNVVNGEIVVPPGSYFAMGDNRDNSLDSRYWGFVPRENITGKPTIIFWSYEASSDDLKDYTWHHLFDLAQHFFSKTRWSRTLNVIRGYPLQ